VLTEDGVDGVHGDLVLRGIADEALGVGEGDVGRRGAVPWSLAMISTRSCCHTPTHEYVVPRSMPIAGPSPLVGAIAASRSLAAADEKGQLGLGFSRLRLEQRRLLLRFSDAEAAPMSWWYL